MFARVIRGVVLEGKMEELIQTIERELKPTVLDQPGRRGGFLLTDAGTGQAMTISLWESREAMVAGETSGYLSGLFEQVAPFLDEAPSVRDFRVSSIV